MPDAGGAAFALYERVQQPVRVSVIGLSVAIAICAWQFTCARGGSIVAVSMLLAAMSSLLTTGVRGGVLHVRETPS